jgi:predicted Ser/Thr protein kinase
MHVSFWVKGEKLRNPLTGQHEDPDERLMREVEQLLGGPDKPEPFRHALINTIAAWAIDRPGERVDNTRVFPGHLRKLREAVFSERRVAVARLCRDLVVLIREEGSGLDEQQRKAAGDLLAELGRRYGYEESSATDAAIALVRERFADVLH